MSKFNEIFTVLNEIIEAKRMSTVERRLIRKRKDLIDYIGTHFSSFLRTLLIEIILFVIISNILSIDMSIFLIISIAGFAFIFTNKHGYKTPFFLLVKYIKQIIILLPQTIKQFNEHVFQFRKNYPGHNVILSILAMFFLFVIGLIAMPIPYVLITMLYVFILAMIIYINNDTFAMIIAYFLILFLQNVLDIELLYWILLTSPLVFFIVDYEVRITLQSIVLEKAIHDYNEVELSNLVHVNSSIEEDLFYYEKKYYLINKNTKKIDIYYVESKFDLLKQKTINYFQSKVLQSRQKR